MDVLTICRQPLITQANDMPRSNQKKAGRFYSNNLTGYMLLIEYPPGRAGCPFQIFAAFK
jgi:hypothetical protein